MEDLEECPHIRKSWYRDAWLCELSDKLCSLESGDKCEIYELILGEWEVET